MHVCCFNCAKSTFNNASAPIVKCEGGRQCSSVTSYINDADNWNMCSTHEEFGKTSGCFECAAYALYAPESEVG